MTDPANVKQDVEAILAEFATRKDLLESFCAKTKVLIDAALEDANIRFQSIQARVKTKKKLREKYLEKPDYKRLDDITDLAGLRVITYYEDEIDLVVEVITREFALDPKHTNDRRKAEPDKFGYRAFNCVCSHSAERAKTVEYKRFAQVTFEIQVTSVLGHAWAEIEHVWYDLKDAYPDDIKRRLQRMAALLRSCGIRIS
jgi:putative GTP pyrophosphokinase